MADEKPVRDLFGDLVTLPSGRRGRPAHRWCKSNGDRVIIGLAMGLRPSEIASGLGISLPTLRKHYFSELRRAEMQRSRFELWRAETLARLAGEGNVGAMKELTKLFEAQDRRRAEEALKDGEEPARPERIGKKEAERRAALKAAESGDGNWGELLRGGYDA